jgi:type III restriction enzyme
MPDEIKNNAALEPLYKPWEEPNHHRQRAEKENEPALIINGRRPSSIAIVQNLRQAIAEWRATEYSFGCSDTSRELLLHWFGRDHRMQTASGETVPFHYYFCQREAIETLVYLLETRQINSLSALTAEYGGATAELAALGINPNEDLWPRYAFKVATGAGKTKIMSLAIVWSYFHALRESDSPMARHFLIIAPNLTVFERLKEDFGDGHIFERDPLIPPAWRGDWNLSVVLQDEASGTSTGGTLYLTNIHRLYEAKARKKTGIVTYDWLGPAISKATALDNGEALRSRVTSHPRLMVLNDEAHHVWDSDSAWNDALGFLNDTLKSKYETGLTAQLDFSATPKDNKGNLFKHIICDTPLGEAVDAGIVKTPVIGRSGQLKERVEDNAAFRYEEHLMLGYKRWLISKEEWEGSGKKALLFVMCDDTTAADQITGRLNTDPLFTELNGKTINLHTNLKGKLKKRKQGGEEYLEFIEDENEISDEDLRELRKLSRELDQDSSPYRCIVSVLMLREGWDVRNVTTIVPLRPYSSKANILPEQTLGRGLRRMTYPGQAAEIVTVVEHPAFTSLYREQLSQQGLPIEVVDVDKVPRTTVSIFPDSEHKDFSVLDIKIPRLAPAYVIDPELLAITIDEVKRAFSRYRTLPLGKPRLGEIEYEGRTLFTNEIVEQMKIQMPLLQSGVGAVSFYREELERIIGIRGTHSKIAPLIQQFLEDILFEQKVSIFGDRLVSRLADSDVREHLRAVFVPLMRSKITLTQKRILSEDPQSIANWRPFQVTHSENHPTLPADRTAFNLVPCNRDLEVALSHFADRAPDIATFSKNAGPQALRIDYLASGGRLAFYTPDFFIRKKDGKCLLVETKGREDKDVPAKARAAREWCKSASVGNNPNWSYLYVPEGVFQRLNGNHLEDLERASAPALADLLHEADHAQLALPLYEVSAEIKAEQVEEFIAPEILANLPSRYLKSVEEAVSIYKFLERKGGSLSACFTPLLGPLDEAAKGMIFSLLEPSLPANSEDLRRFFEPSYQGISDRDQDWLRKNAAGLKKALVYKNPIMPLGLLSFCLDFSQSYLISPIAGIFEVIINKFAQYDGSDFSTHINAVRAFRNTYIAHQEKELTDATFARESLQMWIRGLADIYEAHHGFPFVKK